MGSCLGHCRLTGETFGLFRFYSKAKENVGKQLNLTNNELDEHIICDSPLHEVDEYNSQLKIKISESKCSFERLKSVFTNIKSKYISSPELGLELLNEEWSISEEEEEYFKSSINFKQSNQYTSASINSLDLEWEHLPEMTVFSTNVDKEEPKSITSAEGWSRISSADSLEWDHGEVDVVDMKEEIDTETEQLLQEIEMLSLKTLEQTQEWAS